MLSTMSRSSAYILSLSFNVILQDKTGVIDAKVWEPGNPGIGNYDTLDYIDVCGDVNSFQGSLQVSIKRWRSGFR